MKFRRSTSILDYPASVSMYERESLAAEAQLKAERKKKKQKPAIVKRIR